MIEVVSELGTKCTFSRDKTRDFSTTPLEINVSSGKGIITTFYTVVNKLGITLSEEEFKRLGEWLEDGKK